MVTLDLTTASNKTGTAVYTYAYPPPGNCVSGMYAEEDKNMTMQSEVQNDDSTKGKIRLV